LRPDGFVVSLQNCINEERIAAIVGWGKTLGCIASLVAAELYAPGHVKRTVPMGGEKHIRVPRRRGAWPGHAARRGGRGSAAFGRQLEGHHQPVGRALVEARR
jgi:hypothetical protein